MKSVKEGIYVFTLCMKLHAILYVVCGLPWYINMYR